MDASDLARHSRRMARPAPKSPINRITFRTAATFISEDGKRRKRLERRESWEASIAPETLAEAEDEIMGQLWMEAGALGFDDDAEASDIVTVQL